jgi:hypothetical protein
MATTSATTGTAASPVPGLRIAGLVALGGLCGLAWAAGLRGLMALVAGDDGVGGGAIAIPLMGMAGCKGVSERGPVWARVLAGLPSLGCAIPHRPVLSPGGAG